MCACAFAGLLHGTQGNSAGKEFRGADVAQSVRVPGVRAGVSAWRQPQGWSDLCQRCLLQLSRCHLHCLAVR